MHERPTDNAWQERFYRTLKQEEVYCHEGYVSLDSAKASVGYWLTTTMKSDHTSRCFSIHRRLFTAAVTRPDFWKIIGATSRRPRRKEDRSGYSIIRNQQLFSLEMSENRR